MRNLLNTLFVTSQGAYLRKEGESVVVSVERQDRLRMPLLSLNGIVCFGQVSCSPFLMHACADGNVAISFLSENGRFLARVLGPTSGNVLLRRQQYRRTDCKEDKAGTIRAILAAKIGNERRVLLRGLREHADKIDAEKVSAVERRLGKMLERLAQRAEPDELRGMEGDSAKNYFAALDALITVQKDMFFFVKRTRRPPRDNLNCLLSFLYTLLLHDVRSAVESVGLDPQVGFLHEERPGRPGLALDLIEEFRAPFADRLALSLINRQQVRAAGFKTDGVGGVTMDDATRKTVLAAYQKRKQAEIEHPFLREKMQIGLLFHVQAQLFARYIRGELDGYPPVFWR